MQLELTNHQSSSHFDSVDDSLRPVSKMCLLFSKFHPSLKNLKFPYKIFYRTEVMNNTSSPQKCMIAVRFINYFTKVVELILHLKMIPSTHLIFLLTAKLIRWKSSRSCPRPRNFWMNEVECSHSRTALLEKSFSDRFVSSLRLRTSSFRRLSLFIRKSVTTSWSCEIDSKNSILFTDVQLCDSVQNCADFYV